MYFFVIGRVDAQENGEPLQIGRVFLWQLKIERQIQRDAPRPNGFGLDSGVAGEEILDGLQVLHLKYHADISLPCFLESVERRHPLRVEVSDIFLDSFPKIGYAFFCEESDS